MEEFINFIFNLANSNFILENGYWLVLFVIFAESGLFFGFFLPGDYLMFLTGIFCASGGLDINIYVMIAFMILSGTLGNMVGYWFGRKLGISMYSWKDNLFFKKKYLKKAEEFYEKKGYIALVGGKYLPIIRTFAPIVAGIVKLKFKAFFALNLLGNVLWIGTLTLVGYFLGIEFPAIVDYVHYIIIGFIVITTIPFLFAFLRMKLSRKKS